MSDIVKPLSAVDVLWDPTNQRPRFDIVLKALGDAISGNKVAVADASVLAALNGVIASGAVKTSNAALEALISGGALKVTQQGEIQADIIDADMESLLDAALPSGSDDPQAAVTAGAAWADIEIPANAQIAVVRLKSYDCYLVAQAARSAANGGSDPAADGVEYMVNKEHYLSVRGKAGGGLCYKKVAAGAADVTVTFLLSQ